MPFLRNTLLACSPARLAAAMERESRQWIMRCKVGHEQSVWDAGGIRYLAIGNPTRYAWCPKCQRLTWQKLHRRKPQTEADDRLR